MKWTPCSLRRGDPGAPPVLAGLVISRRDDADDGGSQYGWASVLSDHRMRPSGTGMHRGARQGHSYQPCVLLCAPSITMNAGHGARRTTFAATLPRSLCCSPVCLGVPITMRSTSRLWATRTMVSARGPAATCASQAPWKVGGLRSWSWVSASALWSRSTTIGRSDMGELR